jgi:hypothetical protein
MNTCHITPEFQTGKSKLCDNIKVFVYFYHSRINQKMHTLW